MHQVGPQGAKASRLNANQAAQITDWQDVVDQHQFWIELAMIEANSSRQSRETVLQSRGTELNGQASGNRGVEERKRIQRVQRLKIRKIL